MRFWSKRKLETPTKTALVLGSGGARGWAHVGVIKALSELDFVPDIVVGSSIGSIVGAIYASGEIAKAEAFAPNLDWTHIAKLFFEFGIPPRSGLVEGKRVMKLLGEFIPAQRIQDLPLTYAAVATDLYTQSEVVLKEGNLLEAIRASIAIPGLFTPVRHGKKWLVDGGLVNPLPVSVAREMGAGRVIGVDINLCEGEAHTSEEKKEEGKEKKKEEKAPFLPDVITRSFRVAENSITRERLLRQPPDVLIQPKVGHIATLEFQCGEEAMKAGYEAAREKLSVISCQLSN